MSIPQEKLKDLAMIMLNYHKSNAIVGNFIFGVWKDEDQLKTWINLEGKGDDCRILTGQSDKMTEFPIINKNEVVIIGICLAQRQDYSDLRLLFYVTMKPK